MLELKSLEEIKLEIDIIILDIDSLEEHEKEDALKYLEISLENFKIVNNWEEEESVTYEPENVENYDHSPNKRIKLDSEVVGKSIVEVEEVSLKTNNVSDTKEVIEESDETDSVTVVDVHNEAGLELENTRALPDCIPLKIVEDIVDDEEDYVSKTEVESDGYATAVSRYSEPATDDVSLEGPVSDNIYARNERPDEYFNPDPDNESSEEIENDNYFRSKEHEEYKEIENGYFVSDSIPIEKSKLVAEDCSGNEIKEAENRYSESGEFHNEDDYIRNEEFDGYSEFATKDDLSFEGQVNEDLYIENDQNLQQDLYTSSEVYPKQNIETEDYPNREESGSFGRSWDDDSSGENLLVEHLAPTPVPATSLYNGKVPTCNTCGTSFPSLGSLDSHIRSMHGKNARNTFDSIRPNPIVKRVVISEAFLDVNPDGDGMYPCSYCSHRATKRYDMKNHMNRHTGKFRCDVCDVNLSRLQSLNNHNTTVDHKKKLNEQMRMSPQPTFDQPDSNKGDVIEQLFTENVSVDGQDFPMDLLLGSSPVKNDDDDFINSTVGAPSFEDASNIQQVNMETPQQFSNIKSRSSFENGSRPQHELKCELCGNIYYKRDSWKRHMITHSGRFKCPTCGFGFTEQGRLNNHLNNKQNCLRLMKSRKAQGPGPKPRHDLDPRQSDGYGYQSSEGSLSPNNENEEESEQSPYQFPPGLHVRKTSVPPPTGNLNYLGYS